MVTFGGTSRWQCLHTVASALIHSAQNGHLRLSFARVTPDTKYSTNASGPSNKPLAAPATVLKPRRCAAETPISAPTKAQNKNQNTSDPQRHVGAAHLVGEIAKSRVHVFLDGHQ